MDRALTALGERWARLNAAIARGEQRVIDVACRSRKGLWWTIAVLAAWMAWNRLAPRAWWFDPFPFIWAMGVLTEFSYLQNIVIMTDQRTAAIALQRVQRHMVHLLETNVSQSEVLVEHAHQATERDKRAEARDARSEARDELILARLDQLAAHQGIHWTGAAVGPASPS